MKKFTLTLALVAAIATVLSTGAFAQSESSVEDEYLSDVDAVVILGLASSNEYENKLYALKMVEKQVANGNTSKEIMQALTQLAGEGLTTKSYTSGKIINNFPDIRRSACLILGKVKTDESKNFLVQVVLAENEPMVIGAAVNSLGNIGLNKDDEVVTAIAFMNRRNQVINPTSSLASEVVDAFEKLADATENRKTMVDCLTLIASDYHYAKATRQKALKLMKSLTSNSSSGQSSDNQASDNQASGNGQTADEGAEPEVE